MTNDNYWDEYLRDYKAQAKHVQDIRLDEN